MNAQTTARTADYQRLLFLFRKHIAQPCDRYPFSIDSIANVLRRDIRLANAGQTPWVRPGLLREMRAEAIEVGKARAALSKAGA